MKKKPSKYRVYWIASLGLVLVLCTYVGEAYYKLRSLDYHLPLVVLSITPELGWLSGRLVEFELRRRIENGDFDGAFVLTDTLTIGLTREELRRTAIRRAEWLVVDLVDVNAEGMILSPLHQAVAANNVVMAGQLIRLGADPRVKSRTSSADDYRVNALDYADMVSDMFPERDMTALIRVLESASEHQ